MSEAPQFQQSLGLFDATMVVAGSMIGSGIFIVSADITRDVGSAGWLLLIWVLTGVITVVGALCYAELAGMMPHAGGQYVFLRDAYSPLWGFLYGWTCFLVIQTGFIAAVGVAFAKFLGVFVPELSEKNILWSTPINLEWTMPIPWMDKPFTFFEKEHFSISSGQLVAVGLAIVLTLWNCRGVREGKWVQNIFTVAKLVGVLLLIVVGCTWAVSSDAISANSANFWSGLTETKQFRDTYAMVPNVMWAGVLVVCGAMVGSLFSADAWNNVTFIASEIRNPQRNLPWSLILGAGGVIVLYLLANAGYLLSLTLHEIATAPNDRVATAVIEKVAPGFGVKVMAAFIMVSAFGCVNGIILSGARLYYAMARDGLFFQSAGSLNNRGVPAVGLVLQGLWSILLIFSGTYSDLLDYIIFAALFFYVLTIGALFVFRRREPDRPRPYRVPGYPLVPILYLVMCSIIMVALLIVKPKYSWPSFVIVLSGIPVYFLWRVVGKTPANGGVSRR